MIRRLLIFAAIAFVWWWARRLLRSGPRQPDSGQTPTRGASGDNTVMVRDRVCETFVAENRALSLDVQGSRHYFCSERCRDKFLAGRGLGSQSGSSASSAS